MKRLARLFALVFMMVLSHCGSQLAMAQTGALIPWTAMNFLNQDGQVAANGKVCTYAAGTTTPLVTYSDYNLMTPNLVAVSLGSDGRPTSGAIYLGPARYKIVLRSAGSDATCATGTVYWTLDNVYDIGELLTAGGLSIIVDSATITTATIGTASIERLNNVRMCDQFPGSDMGAKINACITDLPGTGGTADARGLQGAQSLTTQVLITKPNVIVRLGAAQIAISGITPQQGPPFILAAFQVNGANNVSFLCDGTTLKLAAGEHVNPFGYTYSASDTAIIPIGGRVAGCELDGNKANNTSITDDTFQVGIAVVAGNNALTVQTAQVFENNYIHDFNQYGITTYGENAGAIKIVNNKFKDIGKNGDVNSNGDGVYLNKGASYSLVHNNTFINMLRHGVHLSSVGSAQLGDIVSNNSFYGGVAGVRAEEDVNLSSVSGVGETGLVISGNFATGASQYCYGISSTNNVGFIKNFTVIGNVGIGCQYGLLVGSSDDATNFTGQGLASGNVFTGNTAFGIGITSFVKDFTFQNNYLVGNTSGQYVDNGISTSISGNKLTLGDTTFYVSSPGGILSTAYDWGDITRTWSLAADGSGNSIFQSGDAAGVATFVAGRIFLNSAGGAQTTSPNFSALPTCNSTTINSIISVQDSNTITWGANIAGGGSNHVLAYCDGAHWTVAGK